MSTKIKSDGWSTDYYQLPEGATELQDLIEYRDMNFSVGNIFKAAYRLGMKDGTDSLYDLRKIMWYAEREISRRQYIPPEQETKGRYCVLCDEKHEGFCPFDGKDASPAFEYYDLYAKNGGTDE